MRPRHIVLITLAASLSWGAGIDRSQPGWTIEALSLHPDTNAAHKLPDGSEPNDLAITVSNRASGIRFNLSAVVRLTAVKESFISGDKLAAIDVGGNAAIVAIFDLSERRLIDWFYCDGPRRVSDDWIGYVEWYPNHGLGAAGTGWAKEVLLIYDLRKTPAENRLPSAQHLPIPAPIANGPIQVGLPVYPESNVRSQSYMNLVRDPAEGDLVLQNAGYVMLSSEKLVFAAAQGGPDFRHLWDYLVVVDLHRGIDRPVIKTIEIPKDQLKKPGENPRFVKINDIEKTSEDTVRLRLPPSEYGVDSIVVSLPPP